MGIAERKARQKQEVRDLIVAAAQKIFLREGRDGVSMRKIAREMEYSPTTIYHHFRDKGALLRCLLESYYEKLRDRMREIDRGTAGADGPEAALAAVRQYMRAYVELGLENPSYYRLAFVNRPRAAGRPSLDPDSLGWAVFSDMTKKVEACIRTGAFPEMDPPLAAGVIWAVGHGATSLLLSLPEVPWADRDGLIDRIMDSAIDGLRLGGGD